MSGAIAHIFLFECFGTNSVTRIVKYFVLESGLRSKPGFFGIPAMMMWRLDIAFARGEQHSCQVYERRDRD